MAVAPAEAACAIRVSLGWASTDADVDRFLSAWTRLFAEARRVRPPARAGGAAKSDRREPELARPESHLKSAVS
jgi:hypothetical protein